MSEHERGPEDVLARYRRAISPTATERARLLASVAARTSGAPPGVPPTTPRGGGSWLAIVGVAIVVGGAGWWATRGTIDRTAPSPAVASTAVAPIAPAPSPQGPKRAEPVATPAEPTPAPTNAATEIDTVTPSRDATTPNPTRRRSAPRMQPTPAPDRPAPTAASDPSLVDAEVALLRAANTALREGRDADAAAGFAEHARRFADGALVELREVGRALLRCRAADRDPGEDVAGVFAARFPGSPHRDRIARACRTDAEPK